MKRTVRTIFAGILVWGGLLIFPTASAATGEAVAASLITDARMPITGGEPFYATVILDLKPGWHTYWLNPGDSGQASSVTWQLPEGWTAGPLEFSVPEKFFEPGEMIVYGYEGRSLLRALITPPKILSKAKANGAIELKAAVSWLACKELCVPGSAEISCGLDTRFERPLGIWPDRQAPPFPVLISSKEGRKVIQLKGLSQDGSAYDLFPAPGGGSETQSSGNAVTRTGSGAGSSMVFSLPWKDSTPFRALLVEGKGELRRAWWISDEASSWTAGEKASPATGSGILLAALLGGLLGGMILNLMPCVLPVISLKIFGFIAQAGESPSRILRHGLAFSAGIFLWFLGLGVLVISLKAGGTQVTWGAFQFQNPLFVVFLSVLVFLFALNLFGVFEISLPGNTLNPLDRAASRGGYSGSFFQGLFATLLATPCTAPFLGSALGFAFSQSPAVILAMFAAVALGMSLPYLLLSAYPGWGRLIPKPGVWMERLRQFMGFPLLATNLWLLWVLELQRGEEASLLMGGLFLALAFCAWLYGALMSAGGWLTKRPLMVLALLAACAAVLFVMGKIQRIPPVAERNSSGKESGIAWIPYSADVLQSLRSEGRPVLLDFTASWCLTCQFNERTAINIPSVRTNLHDRGITAMKGDWTNADPAITSALKSFGRVGVPLVVYYPPGRDVSPYVLPELLTERIVLEALAR